MDEFSFGDLVATSDQEISVERRYRPDGLAVDEVFIDFDVALQAYESDGAAGLLSIRHGSHYHLRQNFNQGDGGEPEYTISGTMVVSTGQYALATLEPFFNGRDWGFHVIPEEECPEGFVCVDLPET